MAHDEQNFQQFGPSGYDAANDLTPARAERLRTGVLKERSRATAIDAGNILGS